MGIPRLADPVVAGRQAKLENSTLGYVGRSPQPPAVGLDDRSADRQAHSHPAGLRGEEVLVLKPCLSLDNPNRSFPTRHGLSAMNGKTV